MKKISSLLNESKIEHWNLWDYTDKGEREILIWYNPGPAPEQSDIEEMNFSKVHKTLQNIDFGTLKNYVNEHKNEVDKVHLDVMEVKIDKIEDIFK